MTYPPSPFFLLILFNSFIVNSKWHLLNFLLFQSFQHPFQHHQRCYSNNTTSIRHRRKAFPEIVQVKEIHCHMFGGKKKRTESLLLYLKTLRLVLGNCNVLIISWIFFFNDLTYFLVQNKSLYMQSLISYDFYLSKIIESKSLLRN